MSNVNAILAGICNVLNLDPATGKPMGSLRDASTRDASSAPKTSTRIKETSTKSNFFASNGETQADDGTIRISVVGNKRIKLPKRIFNGKTKVSVGGVWFKSLASDQGRSGLINPREVFDAHDGDVIVITQRKGQVYDFTIESGTPEAPARANATNKVKVKGQSKAVEVPKFTSKRTPQQQQNWDNAPVIEMDEDDLDGSYDNMIEHVGRQALTNYHLEAKGKFTRNQNIIEANAKSTMGLEYDAREYLTSEQNSRLRKARKFLKNNGFNVSPKQVIMDLNDQVWE